MSEIEKMKTRWQEKEQHNDTTLDYAISQIYTHAKLIDQLQARNKELRNFIRPISHNL